MLDLTPMCYGSLSLPTCKSANLVVIQFSLQFTHVVLYILILVVLKTVVITSLKVLFENVKCTLLSIL